MADEAVQTDLLDTKTDATVGDAKADAVVETKTDATKAAEVKTDPKTETKTDAAKEAKTDTKDGEAKPFDAAALKLPEGFKADDPVLADFVKFVDGEKFTTAQGQKLVDMALARDVEIIKARDAANAEAWQKTGDAWKATTAKENTPEQLSDAKTALGKWFDADTVKLFESMRFTDHPGLVKGLRAIGAAIKDDTFVPGNAGSGNGAFDARKQFPNSNMNP